MLKGAVRIDPHGLLECIPSLVQRSQHVVDIAERDQDVRFPRKLLRRSRRQRERTIEIPDLTQPADPHAVQGHEIGRWKLRLP